MRISASIALAILAPSALAAQLTENFSTFRWNGQEATVKETFDITLDAPASVQITDFKNRGDVFEVYDNGKLLGQTSAVERIQDGEVYAATPEEALKDSRFSNGIFPLSQGQHKLSIKAMSPYDAGTAAIRLVRENSQQQRLYTDKKNKKKYRKGKKGKKGHKWHGDDDDDDDDDYWKKRKGKGRWYHHKDYDEDDEKDWDGGDDKLPWGQQQDGFVVGWGHPVDLSHTITYTKTQWVKATETPSLPSTEPESPSPPEEYPEKHYPERYEPDYPRHFPYDPEYYPPYYPKPEQGWDPQPSWEKPTETWPTETSTTTVWEKWDVPSPTFPPFPDPEPRYPKHEDDVTAVFPPYPEPEYPKRPSHHPPYAPYEEYPREEEPYPPRPEIPREPPVNATEYPETPKSEPYQPVQDASDPEALARDYFPPYPEPPRAGSHQRPYYFDNIEEAEIFPPLHLDPKDPEPAMNAPAEEVMDDPDLLSDEMIEGMPAQAPY
ncbi:hypothetical protein EC973_006496 [Apophysomyces ossiformis]|uniref:Uncharacterized protein n=1 Tax=Apophysomyces ossiformis TaxID=679940 RepID=A0A8H7BNF0_9FUNG|nr:hypothetical protein EC973_006496 [Apophysomyces ossiformis]